MIRMRERIVGEFSDCEINTVTKRSDYAEVMDFATATNPTTGKPFTLSFDTESTGINMFHPDWYMRLFQFGDEHCVYVIPNDQRKLIEDVLSIKRKWILHNAPHDVRSVDRYLGYETGILPTCQDTFIRSHLLDPRPRTDGGTGHQLEDLCVEYVDRTWRRFERNLKAAFKQIEIPIPGIYYKSGPRKGLPKSRKAKLEEGWRLIDTYNEAYLRYAGSDVLGTMRLHRVLIRELTNRPLSSEAKALLRKWGFKTLIEFEHELQRKLDNWTRRGMLIDEEYALKAGEALIFDAETNEMWAEWYGVNNVQSGPQVADALLRCGADLTERTKTGKFKTDNKVLEKFKHEDGDLGRLVNHVLTAKQLKKRKKTYVDMMLRERDSDDRLHMSIKTLAARTARMSAGALHQLPSHEKRIRQCVVAAGNCVIFSVDFDQQEMRVAGALSGEEKIIEAAHRGDSIHKLTARTIFGKKYTDLEYKYSKNLNFGWLFGGGATTLSRQTGIEHEAAADLIRRYSAGYPTLNAWKKQQTRDVLESAFSPSEYAMFLHLQRQMWECDDSVEGRALKRAYRAELDELCRGRIGTVVTPIGRYLPVEANKAYRVVNYLVQSTSRDITARGAIKVSQSRHGKYALMVIHDEILGEAPIRKAQKVADEYAELMTMTFMDVPITASGKVYGRSWGDGYGD